MGDFDAINIFSKGIITMAIDLAGIQAAAAAQGGVAYDPEIAAQLAAIEANKKVNPVAQGTVDTAGIAAAAAAQEKINPRVTTAEEQANIDAIARIEANRTNPNPPQTPQEAVAAYQQSQALDSNGNLKAGYTYDEFGTPVKSSTNDQKTVSGDPSAKADHGPAYDDEGNLMPGFTVNENGDAVWVSAGYNDKTGKTIEPIKDDPGVKADHGPAYDDDGNLMPGFAINENGDAVWMGAGYNDKTGQFITPKGITVAPKPTLVKNDFMQKEDWRVRLSLAPHANYLYKTAKATDILYPLLGTDGVIFPYTPTVSVNYAANYEGIDLAHTNYKMYQYKNSEVGSVTITGTFTAQDNQEANYLLAVMHFFKSVTKMFYGQDTNPKNGTPPPLCYLSGFGAYQFDNHPLAITSFNMSLPDDVDYIRAGKVSGYNVTTSAPAKSSSSSLWDSIKSRLSSSRLKKGGLKDEPVFTNLSTKEATYVPTKMVITITAVPIVTRNDISNNFSVEEYAKGTLTRGSKRPQGGGGIW
jgi:hypothetical protein